MAVHLSVAPATTVGRGRELLEHCAARPGWRAGFG